MNQWSKKVLCVQGYEQPLTFESHDELEQVEDNGDVTSADDDQNSKRLSISNVTQQVRKISYDDCTLNYSEFVQVFFLELSV